MRNEVTLAHPKIWICCQYVHNVIVFRSSALGVSSSCYCCCILRFPAVKPVSRARQLPWCRKAASFRLSFSFHRVAEAIRDNIDINHGPLHTRTEILWPKFENLKCYEISKNDSNIIWRTQKVALILKISRLSLKNSACYSHLKFQLLWPIKQSVLQLQSSNSRFK